MTKKEAIAIAAKFFPNYKTVNAFHVSSDGQVFAEKHQAENHGNRFKKEADKVVITVTRDEVVEDADEKAQAAATCTAIDAEIKALATELAAAPDVAKPSIQAKLDDAQRRFGIAYAAYNAL